MREMERLRRYCAQFLAHKITQFSELIIETQIRTIRLIEALHCELTGEFRCVGLLRNSEPSEFKSKVPGHNHPLQSVWNLFETVELRFAQWIGHAQNKIGCI